MAADELRETLELHRLWVESEGRDGKRAGLNGVDLRGADLRRAVLADADLQGANLAGAQLQRAVLFGANLRGANLEGAQVVDCQLNAATAEKSQWSTEFLADLASRGARLSADLIDRLGQGSSAMPAAVPPGPTGQAYEPFDPQAVEELERLTRERAQHARTDTLEDQEERGIAINRLVAEMFQNPPARGGDIVLHCRLHKILGKGNYGTVWEATDTRTGAKRAVKLFDAERLGLGLSLYHFRRGVRAMEHLEGFSDTRPPSVIRLYEFDDARLAFSMRFVEGGNLYQWTNRWSGVAVKVRVFRVICEAVAFAHAHKILHRDIKPANIVVTKNGDPVLTDFDIADLLFVQTQSAAAVGAICYAAPDQLERADDNDPNQPPWKRARNPTADIFSLGRLLDFLLRGEDPPLRHEDVPTLAHLDGQPEGLVRIIRRCTLRDPTKRYQRVDQLLADVGRYDSKRSEVGIGKAGSGGPIWRPWVELIQQHPVVAAAAIAAVATVTAAMITTSPQLFAEDKAPQPGFSPSTNHNMRVSKVGSSKATSDSPVPAELVPPHDAIVTENGGVWLIPVPGGTFMMGSPKDEEGRFDDEPLHEVAVSAFLIGKFEVTNGQYGRFLAAEPNVEKPRNWRDDLPRWNPVVGVSWQDANRFAEWAGGRLPTEAEWEYAARAGTATSRYESLKEIAWYEENSGLGMHRVGELKPNKFGTYDMLGNVWEWTADCYAEYQSESPPSRLVPKMRSARVVRGGSWGTHARRARAAMRDRLGPEDRSVYVGFRLAGGHE